MMQGEVCHPEEQRQIDQSLDVAVDTSHMLEGWQSQVLCTTLPYVACILKYANKALFASPTLQSQSVMIITYQ